MFQAMISEIAKNKEVFKPSFDEINKKMSPSELLKSSESFGISGDKTEIENIKNEVNEKQNIKDKSEYSDKINENIRTEKELDIYEDIPLEETIVNDRLVLKDSSINPDVKDAMGRTNLERMEKGLAPLDEKGESYNLHHVGQKNDSPLAELKNGTHKSEYSTLHDTSIKESAIDREGFDKERANHWKARAEEIKQERVKNV
ncbi:MAG: HNH/ENDO VII family nuclease [Arcobacteraceae bacterium]|nr:HNH/ENDO VII family nuclease [Arcobacteraceae bacterium]